MGTQRGGCEEVAMSDKKIRNMDEFAKVSGLSRPTVSKYFDNPDSVKPVTRERIEAALTRYDYRPNIYAVNQNRKLTRNIGIVVPYLADPFFAEIARRLEEECIQAGYRPSLYSSHGDKALEIDIFESLRALKPAGVLLAPIGRGSDRDAVLRFCDDVPVILFDTTIPNSSTAYVGSNNPQFGRVLVEYLCETGAPPCFFEMAKPTNPNANKRRRAYLAAMAEAGHEPCIVTAEGQGWDFEAIGRSGGLAALEAGSFASNTVICSNDRLAIGFLAACYEAGRTVGKEATSGLRVAGQDDHPFSKFTCPSLTTVAQDYSKISEHAARTLFDALEAGSRPEATTLFDGNLIIRNSA